MTSLRDAVREAAGTLGEAGIESPEADAVALAAFALKRTTGEVRKLMILGASAPEGLDDLVAERAARVPLQHLTGTAGFRRLELSVGPGVFVPRFETEIVAGLAICFVLGGPAGAVVVDLCTGSGAIALAIKDEVPAAEVHGVELSDQAHAWAILNRDTLGLDVDIRLGDAVRSFPELEGRVDVVVSNPPYIPAGAVPNDPEVRDHDPELALYGGGSDGLRIPVEIAGRAGALLREGGLLVMEHADVQGEHADVQGESLPAALRNTGLWVDVQDHEDLNGRPRAVTAIRGS